MMEAVKQNGLALYHASAELKGDREIVMRPRPSRTGTRQLRLLRPS